MKVPPGVSFHGHGYRLFEGDDIPEDLLAKLSDDHPLKKSPKQTADDLLGEIPARRQSVNASK